MNPSPRSVPSRRPRALRLLGALALLGAVPFALPGCVCPRAPEVRAAATRERLRELAGWMSGTFSSAAQAAADPEDYFDVRLVMVPIWEHRSDGPWIYVEQAIAAAASRPYRQRVYRLRSLDGQGVASDVFLLPGDPLRFAGGWRRPNPLGDLDASDLVPRTGCSIVLRRAEDGTAWAGSTEGTNCPSDLRGARYATSEVTVRDGLLLSWDRGFDDAGRHAWGAAKGPYRFVRTDRSPPAR